MTKSRLQPRTEDPIAEYCAPASDGGLGPRYSNPSDSILERSNNAIIAASIEHSVMLPLDRRPPTSQLPAPDRSISIATAR